MSATVAPRRKWFLGEKIAVGFMTAFGLVIIAALVEMGTGAGFMRQLLLSPEQIAKQDTEKAENSFAYSVMKRRFVDCPDLKEWAKLSNADQDRWYRYWESKGRIRFQLDPSNPDCTAPRNN